MENCTATNKRSLAECNKEKPFTANSSTVSQAVDGFPHHIPYSATRVQCILRAPPVTIEKLRGQKSVVSLAMSTRTNVAEMCPRKRETVLLRSLSERTGRLNKLQSQNSPLVTCRCSELDGTKPTSSVRWKDDCAMWLSYNTLYRQLHRNTAEKDVTALQDVQVTTI